MLFCDSVQHMFRVSRFITPEIEVQVEEDMGEQDVGRDQEEEDMVGQGVDKDQAEVHMVVAGQAVIWGAEVMGIQLVEGEDTSRVREVNGKEDVGMEGMEDQIRVVKHSCKSTQL